MLPNKVPFKEQKRHWDYQFNQEDKRRRLLEKEARRIEEEKRKFFEDHQSGDSYESDKDRQVAEAFAKLMSYAKRSDNNAEAKEP